MSRRHPGLGQLRSDDECDDSDNDAPSYGRSKNKSHLARGNAQGNTNERDATQILKDALKLSNETREVGDENVRVLKEQGEIVERLHRNMDTMDENLKASEKIAQSMKGFFGAVKVLGRNMLKKNKGNKLEHEQVESSGRESTSKPSHTTGTTPSHSNTGHVSSSGDATYANVYDRSLKKDENDMLDMISHNIGQLKANSLATKAELEHQNARLAQMDQRVDQSNDRLKKLNTKISKIS